MSQSMPNLSHREQRGAAGKLRESLLLGPSSKLATATGIREYLPALPWHAAVAPFWIELLGPATGTSDRLYTAIGMFPHGALALVSLAWR